MEGLVNKMDNLKKIFSIYRKMEDVTKTDKDTPFNSTELQLLKELLFAELEGTRLISTQIAKRLGVTRSSVSQMINKLEKEGVVYRQADEIDRKIAYIQMTQEAKNLCKVELSKWTDGLVKIVETFGEEKLEKLLGLLEEFVQTAEKLKEEKKIQ